MYEGWIVTKCVWGSHWVVDHCGTKSLSSGWPIVPVEHKWTIDGHLPLATWSYSTPLLLLLTLLSFPSSTTVLTLFYFLTTLVLHSYASCSALCLVPVLLTQWTKVFWMFLPWRYSRHSWTLSWYSLLESGIPLDTYWLTTDCPCLVPTSCWLEHRVVRSASKGQPDWMHSLSDPLVSPVQPSTINSVILIVSLSLPLIFYISIEGGLIIVIVPLVECIECLLSSVLLNTCTGCIWTKGPFVVPFASSLLFALLFTNSSTNTIVVRIVGSLSLVFLSSNWSKVSFPLLLGLPSSTIL